MSKYLKNKSVCGVPNFVGGPAQKTLGPLVEILNVPFQVAYDDCVVRVIEKNQKLPEFLFGLLALGDVAPDDDQSGGLAVASSETVALNSTCKGSPSLQQGEPGISNHPGFQRGGDVRPDSFVFLHRAMSKALFSSKIPALA